MWTAVAGGGGVLGMFLSALLVDVADWRGLFVLPVILVVAALAMTLTSVPDSRERSAHPFDTVGALVSPPSPCPASSSSCRKAPNAAGPTPSP